MHFHEHQPDLSSETRLTHAADAVLAAARERDPALTLLDVWTPDDRLRGPERYSSEELIEATMFLMRLGVISARAFD